MKCQCYRVDCAVCASNPTPFHIAANPRDTADAVARRYRAVFGNAALERCDEDERRARDLGLPVRARLVMHAGDVLRKQDREAGRIDEYGEPQTAS